MSVETNYKESNIDWLGTIPRDWACDKILSLFTFPNDKVSDVDYEPLSVTYGGVVKQVEDAAKTDNGSNRKLLKVGDIAFNGRSDRMGACGASEYEGSISVVYHVLRKKSPNVNTRYFHHLFRNRLFSQEFYRWGRGIHDDMWTTRILEMKRIQVPVPPLETQKRIADFLDAKTKTVDELIAKKEQLIELLKEKRAAIITQAVTKGLDPKAKLKPSGVEWLGDVPIDYSSKRLRFCFTLVNKKGDGTEENKIALENIEGWTGKFVETDSKYEQGVEFKKDDVLFGKLRPYLAKVFLAQSTGEAVGDLLVYRTRKEISPRYAFYYFLGSGFIDVIKSSVFGARMPRADSFFIGNLQFVYPTKEKQEQIADYLDSEVRKIDEVSSLVESQIEKLKEYRSSLIYSAVTGKLTV